MHLGDVIAAYATAAGAIDPALGARAVVRLSGPGPMLDGVLDDLLVPREDGEDHRAPGARAGRLRLSARGAGALESVELPVRVVRWCGPRSFTGEDAAELIVPGTPAVVARVMGRVLACAGVRAAEPGEFCFRAVEHGKLSVAQAEGLAGVIHAEQAGALEAARRVLDGRQGAALAGAAAALAEALALVEAGIDFVDQDDVVAIGPAALGARLRGVIGTLRAEGARVDTPASARGRETAQASLKGEGHGREPDRGSAGGPPREARASRLCVLLAGAPSAGKSTLFNALLGRARAVTAAEPGTTRDVLREPLRLEADGVGTALTVDLLDAPGLDAVGSGAAGAAGVDPSRQAALRALAEAEVVLWCDPSGVFAGPSPGGAGAETLRVRTMIDRLGVEPASQDQADARPGQAAIGVSAMDGRGLSALRAAIARAARAALETGATRARARGVEGAAVARHQAWLDEAGGTLARIIAMLDERAGALAEAEVIAAELRSALDALGAVTGRMDADAVLGLVFSRFCVGK